MKRRRKTEKWKKRMRDIIEEHSLIPTDDPVERLEVVQRLVRKGIYSEIEGIELLNYMPEHK